MSSWTADTWLAVIALVLSLTGNAGSAIIFFFRSTAKDEIDAALDAVKAENARALAGHIEEHMRLRSTVIEHDRKLIAMDGAMQSLSTKEDMHKLDLSIARLSGVIETVNNNVEHLTRSSHSNGAKLDRLERDRLMELQGQRGGVG